MSRLTLSKVARSYGSFTAVENVNLEIADGEFVTLLGPSGCGKTTTLRMVAGFIAPDSGDILFDGRRMNDVPPHKRNTAMVFQSYALFPHMTVAQNIAFGLRMRKLTATQQSSRIGDVLEMVSLSGLEKRRPGQLSGGQQQRVALARAIVTRPDILLFDEPLSNLDAKLRDKVRIEIRDLQRHLQITSLYVTHDQAEALAISDRIVVMNGGRIEQIGSPDEVYRAPRSSFVADFLGAANIVAAQVIDNGMFQSTVGHFSIPDAIGRIGETVKLSWRPEDMKVANNGSGNIVGGVVRNVVFRGNFIELLVDVSGHSLRAQVDSDSRIRENDAVDFVLAGERIRIIA